MTVVWFVTNVAAAAPVDETPSAAAKTPTQACEAAVTEAIQKSRGTRARQVQFVAGKNTQPPPAVDETIHGEGRYHGGDTHMPFSYRCTVDAQTHAVTGVIFKDTGEPTRVVEKPWQADLGTLSPQDCEVAAAAALKEKFPRAGNVVLSSQSRQLKPAPGGHTYLVGQGSMERAAGMGPSAFTYRCEVESASGKLLGVQTDLVE